MSVVVAGITIAGALVATPAHASSVTVTASVGGEPGTLDSSFGSDGVAALGIAGESVDGVVVEDGGDIVTAVVTNAGVTVVRLKADGTYDTSFGDGGKYEWAGAGYAGEFPKAAIAEDSAGNIYVASSLKVSDFDNGFTYQVALLKLTATGQPDTSFQDNAGLGAGVVAQYFDNHPKDHGTSVVVDDNLHRVYVGAWQGPDPDGNDDGTATEFTVLAYDTTDGSLVPGFGSEGIATKDFNAGNDTVRDLALMPDGRILAVGFVSTTENATADDTGLWMLNTDGSTDTTWGSTTKPGTVEVDFSHSGGDDGARSVTVDAHGEIYVSGTDYAHHHGYVAAFDSSGALDTSFNRRTVGGDGYADAGEVRMDFGAASGASAGLTTAHDGRIVAVGQGGSAAGVARLVDDRYARDTTFGPGGARSLGCDGASGVATQPDDDLVVVGTCSGSLQVWRVIGGTQLPALASPPTAGTASTPLSAEGFSTNGSGRQINVAPGSTVNLAYTYHVPAQPCCAIDQLVTGFVNRGPEQCINLDVPTSGANAVANQSFTAPTQPGHYYIAIGFVQWYGCTGGATGSESWELGFGTRGGKEWPGSDAPNISTYLVEVTVSGANDFALSSGGGDIGAGAHVTPVDDIPLDALTGSLADLAAAPLRGSPLRGSPLRGSELAGSPLRGSPLRGSPLRGSPLRGSPLRGSPIPLSDVPLDLPNTWAAVLTGTIYAGQPLQNVTLQQVLALDPAPAGVTALTLADIDLARTPLRNVSLVAFLLGNTPVQALLTAPGQPGTLPTGTDTTQSLIGLELGGVDLSQFYGNGVHVRGHTLTDAPLSGIRLADMWLAETPLGAVPTADVPASWINAPGSTLAQVQQNDVEHGLTDAATLGAYFGLSNALDVTVGRLLPGLLPRDQLPYDEVDTATIAAASAVQGPYVTYEATYSVACLASGGATSVTFSLPPGFRYKPSSATLELDGATLTSPVTVDTSDGVKVSRDITECPAESTQNAKATIKAEAGTILGPTQASATVNVYDSTATASDSDPVTVVPEQPTAMTAPTQSTLYLGHVGSSGNLDSYTLPDLAPGTQLTVTLSHVPPGQDFDLSVFGPGVPALRTTASPLRGSPLRGSPLRGSGVDDTTLDPTSDGTSAPPEPQTDVPIAPPGNDVVWGISDNRGDGSESVSTLVPDGTDSGNVTIDVSGYNGSSSPLPFSLLVAITPPAAPPACAQPNLPFANQNTPVGTAPAGTLASTTKTLILTSQSRLGDLYGSTAATSVMAKLSSLAGRTDVAGVVASVDAIPAVQSAYDAWDLHPCSPAAANAIVSAINAYVDSITGSNGQLVNIVIAGGDEVIPMARVRDHVDLDNEQTYANDEVYNDNDNPLSAALRAGDLLTDDPYGDFNPIPWLDGQAFVPDVALGRLVETPADISAAVDAYVAANGVRSANAAYTAGYDFNADGAQAVADTVSAKVPLGAATSTINGTWTKTDAVNGMSAAAHGYLSVNAHYDAYRALPASEFTAGTQTQLLTTSNLPSSLSNGTFFTIGCHAGLSVADTFVSLSSEATRKADWPQAVANRGGVSAVNTGYGYGDTAAVAYSEQLMAAFARNLNGSMSIGQALMLAKQGYLHLPLAAVDAKVMEEATFYGLPMYKVSTPGGTPQTLGSFMPAPPAPAGTDRARSAVTPAAFGSTQARDLVAQTTGRGTYYAVKTNPSGPTQPPLSLPGRPLEPLTTDPAPPPQISFPNLVPHGVLVSGLTTHLVPGAIDPVYSTAVPDGGSLDPEPNTTDAFFPATFAGLRDQATTSGLKTVVQLNPGQFRAQSGGTSGFQQLTDEIDYQVLYSNSADVTPPSISTVTGVVTEDNASVKHVTFTVQASDVGGSGVDSVEVLYLQSPAQNIWAKVPLTLTGGVWKGNDVVTTNTVQQYLVQVIDNAYNVAVSSSKGQDFRAETAPIAGAPAVALTGHQNGPAFDGPVTVTLTGTGNLSYTLDGGTTKPYTAPFTVSALTPAPHQLVAIGEHGGTTTSSFTIVTAPPTVTLTSPVDGGTYVVGEAVPATYTCSGAVTSCSSVPSTVDTSPGVHTFSVTASGPGGSVGASATYTVGWRFVGFTQPINDPAGSSVSVFKLGSTIPMKFQLTDVNGALISDSAANALADACRVQLLTTKVGSLSASVDETSLSAVADTGPCFRYDAAADQFIYNLSTKTLTGAKSGDAWRLRVIVFAAPPPSSNRSADHAVVVGLK